MREAITQQVEKDIKQSFDAKFEALQASLQERDQTVNKLQGQQKNQERESTLKEKEL